MSTGKGMNGSPKSADSVIMTDHAMAYVARAIGLRSHHSSQRTGKPFTGRRVAGDMVASVARYAKCALLKTTCTSRRRGRAGCGESRKSGSEGGGWKSARKGNSLAAYPTGGTHHPDGMVL